MTSTTVRRERPKEINLAATPRGIPVCGLGSIAMAVLLTVVVPGAWWFLFFGAMGGVFVGIVMIAATRHRMLSTPSGGSRTPSISPSRVGRIPSAQTPRPRTSSLCLVE